jgi:mRNA-degrading endonuclease toxin of MazEF toxin-antitoxin module
LSLDEQAQNYPFALPVKVDKVEGPILVDQLNSLDWAGRQAHFHSKAEATLLPKVRQYISVLLGIR